MMEVRKKGAWMWMRAMLRWLMEPAAEAAADTALEAREVLREIEDEE
jgi:hypothetical protein